MTTSALDKLLLAVNSGDDGAAEAAVGSLNFDDDSTLPGLLDLAGCGDEDGRWWALRGLSLAAEQGEAQRGPATTALLRALGDEAEAVRCLAAIALGQLQAASALPALLELLTDPSGWVRGAAADGLAMLGETAVPALGEALLDPREGVRVRAAYALHKISSLSSARWLFPALNDPNPVVHTYVYETLDDLGLLDTLLVQ